MLRIILLWIGTWFGSRQFVVRQCRTLTLGNPMIELGNVYVSSWESRSTASKAKANNAGDLTVANQTATWVTKQASRDPSSEPAQKDPKGIEPWNVALHKPRLITCSWTRRRIGCGRVFVSEVTPLKDKKMLKGSFVNEVISFFWLRNIRMLPY